MGVQKELDIIPEQSIFARFLLKPLKDQQMIVKIVKRGDRQRKEKGLKPADLKIYLSMTNREPSEQSFDRVIIDVS